MGFLLGILLNVLLRSNVSSIFPLSFQMCRMVFQVQGKTDKYVKIEQDFDGIEFLGEDMENLGTSIE